MYVTLQRHDDVMTSRHCDDNCNSLRFRPCTSHRCPADTNNFWHNNSKVTLKVLSAFVQCCERVKIHEIVPAKVTLILSIKLFLFSIRILLTSGGSMISLRGGVDLVGGLTLKVVTFRKCCMSKRKNLDP